VAPRTGADMTLTPRQRRIIERKRPRTSSYRLPELVKPDGASYMALYCAAQWIATRGGTLEINPLDEGLWRETFKDLLDRIASEDVKVIGVRERDGATETVSGMHFASCSVHYPFSFSGPQDDLIFSKELCLFSRPYLDDEHWRGGLGDSLEDRGRVRWRRLMVLKADVAHCWPFAIAQDHRTGAPGPTQPGERTPRKQPLRERAQRALHELYPNGVPDPISKSNAELVSAVDAHIAAKHETCLSRDTILRAAGRRK
jgi:hypothetical protein